MAERGGINFFAWRNKGPLLRFEGVEYGCGYVALQARLVCLECVGSEASLGGDGGVDGSVVDEEVDLRKEVNDSESFGD